jgi:hypothetical protein
MPNLLLRGGGESRRPSNLVYTSLRELSLTREVINIHLLKL